MERMDKTQHGRDSEHSDGVSDMLSHDGDVVSYTVISVLVCS